MKKTTSAVVYFSPKSLTKINKVKKMLKEKGKMSSKSHAANYIIEKAK